MGVSFIINYGHSWKDLCDNDLHKFSGMSFDLSFLNPLIDFICLTLKYFCNLIGILTDDENSGVNGVYSRGRVNRLRDIGRKNVV